VVKILLSVFVAITLFGGDIKDILLSYKNEQYWKTCNKCTLSLNLYGKNSDFLNFCAISCVKADDLDKIYPFVKRLKTSPSDRANMIYFMTILYQKELLFHSIIDKTDISSIKLPKINYILSDIFVKYVNKNYTKKGNVYIFKDDKNPLITYKLSIEEMEGEKKIFLKTFKKKIITKTRIY